MTDQLNFPTPDEMLENNQQPPNTYSPTSIPYTNTANSGTYIWNGTAWTGVIDVGNADISSSQFPPADVTDNTLWYNTDDGNLYIYYNDGNSTQWVDTSAGATSWDQHFPKTV